ncbi:MAG: hypothetical protein ACRETQ_05380 [Gammaproteobacteria bacterium]
MKASFPNKQAWLAGLLLAVVCGAAFAANGPFVNSRSEPHGVLYLNYKMVPSRIYPVRVWMVDGKLTNRSNQMVVWMKPGDYKLRIKLTKVVNMDYVPGLTMNKMDAQQMHDLQLKVEAGKSYYIGAKFDAKGAWEPVVWKTEPVK